MNSDVLAEVPGMCGVVDGGIVSGLWGYEAGQSGVGDVFGWFIESGVPSSYAEEAAGRGLGLHTYLTELAEDQKVGEHGLVALDWHNGNRSILVDHTLSGAIVGLTTVSRPEEIYRALIESTAFGTRKIIETFEQSGVPVSEFIVAGGLAKNPLLMQIYSDVTRLPLGVIGSEQGPALGAAIHAAVSAGVYGDVRSAAESMGKVHRDVYKPDAARADTYDSLYAEYCKLHDFFGWREDSVLRQLRRAFVGPPFHKPDPTSGAESASFRGLQRAEPVCQATTKRQPTQEFAAAGRVPPRLGGSSRSSDKFSPDTSNR